MVSQQMPNQTVSENSHLEYYLLHGSKYKCWRKLWLLQQALSIWVQSGPAWSWTQFLIFSHWATCNQSYSKINCCQVAWADQSRYKCNSRTPVCVKRGPSSPKFNSTTILLQPLLLPPLGRTLVTFQLYFTFTNIWGSTLLWFLSHAVRVKQILLSEHISTLDSTGFGN
jgi:hypothetical protein